jgi:hypothetical protein
MLLNWLLSCKILVNVVNGQWSMGNQQWAMVNGQWAIGNKF